MKAKKPDPNELLDRFAVEKLVGCCRETIRARAKELQIKPERKYGRVFYRRFQAEQMRDLRPLDRDGNKVRRGRPRLTE